MSKDKMTSILSTIIYLLPLIFFAVLIGFFWRGLSLDPKIIPSALINKPVPRFILKDVINVNTNFTEKDLLRHVTLLNVWATWCTSCQAEHPFLMDLKRLNYLTIDGIDYKDNLNNSLQWLQQFGNPYQHIGFDNSGKTSMDLGVYGTPETFIVDKRGIIRYRLIGELTPQIWQKQLLPIVLQLENQS